MIIQWMKWSHHDQPIPTLFRSSYIRQLGIVPSIFWPIRLQRVEKALWRVCNRQTGVNFREGVYGRGTKSLRPFVDVVHNIFSQSEQVYILSYIFILFPITKAAREFLIALIAQKPVNVHFSDSDELRHGRHNLHFQTLLTINHRICWCGCNCIDHCGQCWTPDGKGEVQATARSVGKKRSW